MARRFIVRGEDIKINDRNISVIGIELHHINVLRHKVGDIIQINEYEIKINRISETELLGEIIQEAKKTGEPNSNITLYQSYLKSDKMELVVQKAVELGVGNIQPFLSQNCVVKLNEKDKIKKAERLNKISQEASKQCGRTDIVTVGDITTISSDSFKKSIQDNDIVIFAYEKSDNDLREVLKGYDKNMISKIGIIIGSEGGFDEKDVREIRKYTNIQEVSLGERILRAETASIYLLSIINYIMG